MSRSIYSWEHETPRIFAPSEEGILFLSDFLLVFKSDVTTRKDATRKTEVSHECRLLRVLKNVLC
jgi:hypothetical protein